MAEPTKVLNAENSALKTELVQTYNLNPEDILFFEGEKKPFLMYEANSILCKQLTELIHIGVEPIQSPFADSVSVKCVIMTKDGREYSNFGTVNISEGSTGEKLSQQQIIRLANSRALRNVLLQAGIDLIQLHQQQNGEPGDFKLDTVYNKLNREAHQLGKDAFLINGSNKDAWYFQLNKRYGVNHSNELSEFQMHDWVSFLKTLVPTQKLAA